MRSILSATTSTSVARSTTIRSVSRSTGSKVYTHVQILDLLRHNRTEIRFATLTVKGGKLSEFFRDLLVRFFHDVNNLVGQTGVASCEERICRSDGASTTGTSDTVNIVLSCTWHIKVDDAFDILDICRQTHRGKIAFS